MDKPTIALYLFVAVTLAAALYSCSAAISSTSDDWSPESQASAAATSTAVAPILEPTRTYNRDVVPAIQAEEMAQARETIRARAAWDRAVFEVWAIVRIVALVTVALLVVGIGGTGLLMLALAFVRCGRVMVELVPVSVLPGRGRPVLLPGRIYDPSSDAVIDISTPAPANIAKIAACSKGDAVKIAAIACAIRGDTSRGLTRADQRIFELAETE